MHPHVTDPDGTLGYGSTHARAARDVPRALALTALALALTAPFGDWPPDGMLAPASIFGGWGVGLLAISLYRLATPDSPTLVLSREGLLHRLATDRLIPWNEVRAVRRQNVTVKAGLNVWGTHPGAVAMTLSAAFHDRLMQGRRLRHFLFGMGHFGARGNVVDLYVFPKQAGVDGDELAAAIETRWRASGSPDGAGRLSVGAPAVAAPDDRKPQPFTPAILTGTILAGGVVAALAALHLRLWAP